MEDFIQKIIKKAGNATLDKFGKVGVKYTKEHASDVVTEADLLSNKIIVNAIKKDFPDHGIISEEMDEYQKSSEYKWVIDPLDGTRNFATKVPLYGIIIGLAKNNNPILGAIYMPYFDELYFAKKGKGAFMNGNKIHCSKTINFAHSYGIAGTKLNKQVSKFNTKIISNAKKEIFWMNALGSAAVNSSYVSSGRRDWYVSRGGKVWDYTGSTLVMKESGLLVTDMEGRDWKIGVGEGLIAANKNLHSKLLKLIQ